MIYSYTEEDYKRDKEDALVYLTEIMRDVAQDSVRSSTMKTCSDLRYLLNYLEHSNREHEGFTKEYMKTL